MQNWSQNVFNLVTKRAIAETDATVEWVDCNLGSKLTMKYPSIYLLGEGAHGEVLSIAFAGEGQHQDAGAKIIHGAPRTTSSIFAKSIAKDGGRSTYRGLLEVAKGATESRSKVVHLAPNTTSNILAKSISKDGGIMGYRGLVRMGHNSQGSKSHVPVSYTHLTLPTTPYV